MNPQSRINSFKQVFTIDDIRKKQTESTINLRKVKRTEHSIDKRSLIIRGGTLRSECIYNISLLSPELYKDFPHLFHHSATFSNFLKELTTCISSKQLLPLTTSLRKFLSSGIRQIQEAISPGVIKKLIDLMKTPEFSKECVWCLINLTCESKSEEYVKQGLLENLLFLLESNDEELLDSTIWCISNIAGESVFCRDLVLETGVLSRILKLVKLPNCAKNAAWLISNLCKGRPQPSKLIINTVLKDLPFMIDHCDELVVANACETMYYLTCTTVIQEKPWVSKLVNLLGSPNQDISFFALKVIGNFVEKSDFVIKELIAEGLLDKLTRFLNDNAVNVKREALLILSNICAGFEENLIPLFSHKVFHIALSFLKSEEYSLKNEAIWIVNNLKEIRNSYEHLLKIGVVEDLVTILEVQNPNTSKLALDSLQFLLDDLEIRNRFQEVGGCDVLDKLLKHPNNMIYTIVVKLIEKHFSISEGPN